MAKKEKKKEPVKKKQKGVPSSAPIHHKPSIVMKRSENGANN